MGRLTTLLGAPRRQDVTLKNGTTVTLAELSIADVWPYINGETIDPEDLIRKALIDANGDRLLGDDDAIPMAQALELLPHVLKFNGMEAEEEGKATPVEELKKDFRKAAPAA